MEGRDVYGCGMEAIAGLAIIVGVAYLIRKFIEGLRGEE